MADIDSYLLKCALEVMEKGAKPEGILKNCECQMGFLNYVPDNNNTNLILKNGEK